MRRFVLVTADWSGLGWALKLLADGEDVVVVGLPDPEEEDLDGFDRVGTGLLTRVAEAEAFDSALRDATYVLFDSNKGSVLSERLRRSGWKVFGASALSARMEFDRAYAVERARDAGLGIPETVEVATPDEAASFLDANLDRAYVFKPNVADERYRSVVPSRDDDVAANRELAAFVRHVDAAAFVEGAILQERKRGVEVNAELWLYRGQALLATCGLETKLKLTHDYGPQVGCSSDVMFVVPTDCRLIQETVGRMLPFYQQQQYTGFADVNVILGDRDVWFLEVCNRFGYSAHPNIFATCALDRVGSILADWIDGRGDFSARFRGGFGASINLYTDHLQRGLPLHLSPKAAPFFFAYDAYREGDDLLLAGYSHDVGVFAQHGYTIQDAAEACLSELITREAVSFIGKSFRTDLERRDYPAAPLKRFEALTAMGMFEPARKELAA